MKFSQWMKGLAPTMAILALSFFCIVVAPGRGYAQAAQVTNVSEATSVAGISLRDAYFELLVEEQFLAQNVGHTGVTDQDPLAFQPQFKDINTALDALSGPVSTILNVLGQFLIMFFKDLLNTFAPVVGQLLSLITELFDPCGGSDISIAMSVPNASIFTAYTLQDIQVVPSVGDGLHLQITLSDVGVLYALELFTQVGTTGACTDTKRKSATFAYDQANYDVHFKADSAGELEIVAANVSLGTIQSKIPGFGDSTADVLKSVAEIVSGSLDAELTAFALNTVPGELESILDASIGSYFPETGSILPLNGDGQNARYTVEGIGGFVSTGYSPIALPMAPGTFQRAFALKHAATSVSNNLGYTAVGNPTITDDPSAQPPFLSEQVGAETLATLYLDRVSWEHPTRVGYFEGVGYVASGAQPIDDYPIVPDASVDIPFSVWAAEFTPPTSPSDARFGRHVEHLVQDPTSKAQPIPLSAAQIAALVAHAPGTSTTLGSKDLHDLSLRIDIQPYPNPNNPGAPATRYLLDPEGAPNGEAIGTIEQDVLMTVVLVDALDAEVFGTELYFATFVSDLHLWHVACQDRMELTAVNARLASLATVFTALEVADVDDQIAFAQAPVTLFLRAFFGDQGVVPGEGDPRVALLFEGLTAPLVERAAHGMVAIPNMDLPAFAVFSLSPSQGAEQFHTKLTFGFSLAVGQQCAQMEYARGVNTVGGIGTSTSPNMLAMEVSWLEWDPNDIFLAEPSASVDDDPVKATLTRVPPTSSGPLTTRGNLTVKRENTPIGSGGSQMLPRFSNLYENPSRHDNGFMRADYTTIVGDGTRMLYASGAVTKYPFDSGVHYVTATAAGYQDIREALALDPDPTATVELRIHRLKPGNVSCSSLQPFPTDELGGHHHEQSPSANLYEALLFEPVFSCGGPKLCNTVRLVWTHTAPLFTFCPAVPTSGQDVGQAVLDEYPVQAPGNVTGPDMTSLLAAPDRYTYSALLCGDI